jgi:hypothetical protein
MSMKNSNETIGNQTRELPACGEVRIFYLHYIYIASLSQQYSINLFFSQMETTIPLSATGKIVNKFSSSKYI